VSTAGQMTGAGRIIVSAVSLCAVVAVVAVAVRFALTGELDAQGVSWATGLVATAVAILARTYLPEPSGTPSDPVTTVSATPAPAHLRGRVAEGPPDDDPRLGVPLKRES
jgi:hypothetical protein